MKQISLVPLLLVVFAACACAQSPADVFEKAPPKIENALRERIAIFFQAHIDGKFRRAEEVIHKDSLDDFYNAEKQRLISFEIAKITWSEKFTKAVVITDVELDWYSARVGKLRVKPPMKTMWKLDAGKWWWYAPPRNDWETPWGVMKSGVNPNAPPEAPPVKMVDPMDVLNKVTSDRTEINLDSTREAEETAVIRSELQGVVRLEVQPHGIPGLTVNIDRQDVPQGGSAKIRFTWVPPDGTPKSARIVYVHANPLGKVFSFTLTFAPPPPQAPPPTIPGTANKLPAGKG